MSLLAILTEATCADACWYARDEVCRCSCGGANHGVLRTKDGQQPVRTARIDGDRYKLAAVGMRREMYDVVKPLTQRDGFQVITPYGNSFAHYTWKEAERGSPARLKYASAAQINKWPELSAYRTLDRWDQANVCLVWVREERYAPTYCPTSCVKCDEHKAQYFLAE